ncbi:MAG: hypothetical protein WA004_08395, partial [Saprospiraceae bacterium]
RRLQNSAVLMYVDINFDTSSEVHLRSAPLHLPERLLRHPFPFSVQYATLTASAPKGGLQAAPAGSLRRACLHLHDSLAVLLAVRTHLE